MSRGRRIPPEVTTAFPGPPTSPVEARSFELVDFRRRIDGPGIEAILGFLRTELMRLDDIGLHDVVVGFSGGLDSVVVSALCQRASEGVRKVHAVTVDLGRPDESARVAAMASSAQQLGLEHRIIDASAVRRAMLRANTARGPWSDINTDTWLIQATLFRAADAWSASVVSTADYSEKLLGRHTECFYGPLEPLGSMFKTEVADLARALGVLGLLSDLRPGCEDYWYDDEVLGAGYDVVDPILYLLVNEQRSPQWIADSFAVTDIAWIERIARRVTLQPLRLGTRCARWDDTSEQGARTAQRSSGVRGPRSIP